MHLLRLLAAALLVAACTGTGTEADPGTAPPSETAAAPAVLDLATVDLAEALDRPVVAIARGEDTARVTIRDLEPRDEPRLLWIHWRRPADGVFRVTVESGEGTRYLTDGPVAAISQAVVPPGETTIVLLVVSETPWSATVVDGTFAALPTLGPLGSVTGAGPTFVAVSTDEDRPAQLVVEGEVLEQAPRLVAFDDGGALVSELLTHPDQFGEPVALPEGATLLLVDLQGPWELRVEPLS